MGPIKLPCIAMALLVATSCANEGQRYVSRDVSESHVDAVAYAAEKRGDRAAVLIVRLEAPRSRVFDALTRCELLRHWVNAAGRTLIACSAEVAAGGHYRHEFGAPDGRRFVVYGDYLEVAAPERLVHTELYEGHDWPVVTVTSELTESGARTTLVQTIEYASEAIRDEDFPNLEHSLAGYAGLQAYLYQPGQ